MRTAWEDKAVFEMIKMKVPEGDRERRYLLKKEIHLEGWEALAHVSGILAPLRPSAP